MLVICYISNAAPIQPGGLFQHLTSLFLPPKSPALSCNENECDPLDGDGHYGTCQKAKRMRTSFKHHQLRTMKSYFSMNHNPDAKDLKQLAQKTGLTKRVLQVWFQNARAKFRRNLLRQENGMTEKASEGSVLPGGSPPGAVSEISNSSMSPVSPASTLTDLTANTPVLSDGLDLHPARSPTRTGSTSLF
nr:LIM/homeobox protein Lhx2-like [Paramormyrops kingsleyae]